MEQRSRGLHKKYFKIIIFIMKKTIFKFSLCCVPILLGLSMGLFLHYYENFSLNGKTLLEVENDYKLKFVDSNNYELYLGETQKVILPVEIVDINEVDGKIVIQTHENAVVNTPFMCTVEDVNGDGGIILKSGKITCIISGVISGVVKGSSLGVGDILGTVNGSRISVEVFWGDRKLSLEEIRGLL